MHVTPGHSRIFSELGGNNPYDGVTDFRRRRYAMTSAIGRLPGD
jgi:hypothetical protein